MLGKPSSRRVGSLIVAGVGLAGTLVLISSYRPFGTASPFNLALPFAPILLAAGSANFASRPGKIPGRSGSKEVRSSAGKVTAFGLALLFVGGCPWVYTPLFHGGRVDSASGMLGTILFLLVGLPGLTIALVGFVNLRSSRRSRLDEGTDPDA